MPKGVRGSKKATPSGPHRCSHEHGTEKCNQIVSDKKPFCSIHTHLRETKAQMEEAAVLGPTAAAELRFGLGLPIGDEMEDETIQEEIDNPAEFFSEAEREPL